MPRNHFKSILAFLHFGDNSVHNPNDPKQVKLYIIRPVIEYTMGQCRKVYILYEFVCIDEELLLWKERSSLKQYISNKRSRVYVSLLDICGKGTWESCLQIAGTKAKSYSIACMPVVMYNVDLQLHPATKTFQERTTV